MKNARRQTPRVVLICHDDDPIDTVGLASWIASTFTLAGIVSLHDRHVSMLTKLKREYRRVGLLRLMDVLLFRVYYKFRHARTDTAWVRDEAARLKSRYKGRLDAPVLKAGHPNSAEVRDFLRAMQPDIVIARCKYILKKEIFSIPRFGTYVLHPGICPEYRNAHGCFWALARRDLKKVGMTLLKVDEGIDTGPVYLQLSYPFDEQYESHVVIQYRVVLENLETIANTLYAICNGTAGTLETGRRSSQNWGQPWMTAYLQWKRSAGAGAVTA